MTAPVTAQPLVAAIASGMTSAGVAFGDGVKPAVSGTKPWVVGWFDAGTIDNRSMRSRDGWSCVATFHSFGLTAESARIANRALRTVVLGLHRAAVGGRVLLMPENLVSVPMSRDDDVDPPLFLQIDEWRFRTSPA
jgi:hypothetical protein